MNLTVRWKKTMKSCGALIQFDGVISSLFLLLFKMNVYTLPRKHSDRARSSMFDRVPASLFQSVRSCPPSNVGYSAWEQTIRPFRASALPPPFPVILPLCSDKKEWMPRHGCRLRFSRSLAIMARSSCRACAGSSGRAAYYLLCVRVGVYVHKRPLRGRVGSLHLYPLPRPLSPPPSRAQCASRSRPPSSLRIISRCIRSP
jgi:hypothetical protein